MQVSISLPTYASYDGEVREPSLWEETRAHQTQRVPSADRRASGQSVASDRRTSGQSVGSDRRASGQSVASDPRRVSTGSAEDVATAAAEAGRRSASSGYGRRARQLHMANESEVRRASSGDEDVSEIMTATAAVAASGQAARRTSGQTATASSQRKRKSGERQPATASSQSARTVTDEARDAFEVARQRRRRASQLSAQELADAQALTPPTAAQQREQQRLASDLVSASQETWPETDDEETGRVVGGGQSGQHSQD